MITSNNLRTLLLLTTALSRHVLGFVSMTPFGGLPHQSVSSTLLKDSEYDGAAPLPLTASDLARIAAVKYRHKTMPLLIMDSMVPGQTMTFESADPKFHNLVHYVLKGDKEIGMIGLNPHTGRPLTAGVTLPVQKKNMYLNPKTNVLTLNVQAKEQFEVQGEPWLYHDNNDSDSVSKDDSSSSAAFYLADVEIVDGRPEDALTDEMAQVTQNLSNQIPTLVGTWVHHLVATNKSAALKMEERMMELGPLPSEFRDQALWVAALLNPTSSTKGEEKICLEIRPAMLSCKNDHDRMILATAALQSSIDHVSGKKRLF